MRTACPTADPQESAPVTRVVDAPGARRRLLPRRPVLASGVSMADLLRFQALMAAEGQSVHLARMCYDKPYAFEQVANGHASASDLLRRLALLLFQAYHRQDEARSLHG